jgi:hypothetical protein
MNNTTALLMKRLVQSLTLCFKASHSLGYVRFTGYDHKLFASG